ncbi:flagellar assembly protein T N-terminal domain-containing protein [Thalassotalea ganghwensis]
MRVSTLLVISLLLLCPPVSAQWYETQGHAFVTNGDEKLARTKAMENALKKALLVAGASVSSVQQVVNGLITQDEINIRATGSVNSLELVSEQYHDDMISVTIRADIFPQENQCFAADYKKAILLTKAKLKERQQANIGGIYALDTKVIKELANKLTQEGLYLHTKLSLKSSTAFSRLNNSLNQEEIKSLTMALASATDSQYVMYSEINDVSLAHDENNSWQFWQHDIYDRHFDLSIYIYNGADGELVFDKTYRGSAPWQFNQREQIDVNSMAFWQSEYGTMIDRVLTQTITDIDENMMCQPTQGKIVRLNGNEVMINLGSRHGVKVGDEFTLLHSNNFTSNDGKLYAGYNVSDFKVKVTQVNRQSAIATTADLTLIDSIQVNDLAVRH